MGDILYPSPAYIESEFQYVEANDVDWDKKINNLYWAGSTTGGFASTDQWRDYHRQRFVSLAQNLRRRQHYYLRERGGVISRVSSSFLNSRLFDVAFTRIFQCEKKYCRDQHMYFKVKSWADKDKALRSRLAFDIDGNGISGRYYKLLASKSAPLKQTLFREWHDERLVPWVHYIPVSQSLEELPELVFYLTSTEAGQKRAREIAEQGRDWFSKAFRDVDLTVYTYRLMLELARLQDPKRPAA
ncbi:capsular associated protein [Coccidioides immitis RMSCC 3703]|nr:capsular associated protein [Coccidioides immitis RMSCC 3703]